MAHKGTEYSKGSKASKPIAYTACSQVIDDGGPAVATPALMAANGALLALGK
jgi:hypothetical protein